MKISLFLLFLCFPGIISAQDTIFMKNGDRIPAVIVSKDNAVIKYRNSSMPESSAVYTIFMTDVKSIHYSDGRIVDPGNVNMTEATSKSAFERAGEYNIGRISIGAGSGLFMRSKSDNLGDFWNAGSTGSALGGNPVFFPLELKISFVTSYSKRSWITCGLQVFRMLDNAIYATGNNALDEISIQSSSGSIILNLGYAFNSKKNLVAIFDPGLDFIHMDGFIRLNGTEHSLYTKGRRGMHLGTGIDWLFSKRFHANFRTGYRFSKAIKENHFDYTSPTGQNHYAINGDPVEIKWNGLYASLGLSASVYFDAVKASQSRAERRRR